MDITLEYLKTKHAEYESAYVEHLGLANANWGAMNALQELIANINASESANDQIKKDGGG